MTGHEGPAGSLLTYGPVCACVSCMFYVCTSNLADLVDQFLKLQKVYYVSWNRLTYLYSLVHEQCAF